MGKIKVQQVSLHNVDKDNLFITPDARSVNTQLHNIHKTAFYRTCHTHTHTRRLYHYIMVKYYCNYRRAVGFNIRCVRGAFELID